VVHLHGGEVTVEGEEGKDLRFIVTLPENWSARSAAEHVSVAIGLTPDHPTRKSLAILANQRTAPHIEYRWAAALHWAFIFKIIPW
jgi:hypothetical protein